MHIIYLWGSYDSSVVGPFSTEEECHQFVYEHVPTFVDFAIHELVAPYTWERESKERSMNIAAPSAPAPTAGV